MVKEDTAQAKHLRATPKLEQSKVKSMRDQATKFAGPYNASTMTLAKSSNTKHQAVLSNIGVRSASGAWVSGANITLTITGPATFASGLKTWSTTSATSPTIRNIYRTGDLNSAAAITISAKITGLAGTTYRWYEAQASNYQRTVSMNPSSSQVTRSLSTSWSATGFKYEISTVADVTDFDDDGVRQSRDQINFHMTQGVWPTGQTVTVTSTLYHHGPDDPTTGTLTQTVPSAATPIGTVTTTFTEADLDASGRATKFTDWVTIPAGNANDWFVWHETAAGGAGVDPWVGAYGVASESFDDKHDWQPWGIEVSTQTGDLDPPTGVIRDQFDVGLQPTPPHVPDYEWGQWRDDVSGDLEPIGVPIMFELYHSHTDPTTQTGPIIPADATLVDTVTSDPVTSEVTGLWSPSVTVPEEFRSGYLTWVAVIDPSLIDPDQNDGMLQYWRSDYGIADETSFNPYTPQIVTEAQLALTPLGGHLVREDVRYGKAASGVFS